MICDLRSGLICGASCAGDLGREHERAPPGALARVRPAAVAGAGADARGRGAPASPAARRQLEAHQRGGRSRAGGGARGAGARPPRAAGAPPGQTAPLCAAALPERLAISERNCAYCGPHVTLDHGVLVCVRFRGVVVKRHRHSHRRCCYARRAAR